MSGGVQRVTPAQVRRELLRMEDQMSRRRLRVGAAVVLAVALALGALAAQFLFLLADVRGDGMAEIRAGDAALCVRSDAPLLSRPAARGDVALVRYADNGLERHALRRVIALEGDEVALDESGRVTLNGAALAEPYAVYRSGDGADEDAVVPGGALENPFAGSQAQPAETPVHADTGFDDVQYPLTVPRGMVFVLCDNRENLLDSRSSRFGLVSAEDVEGLARAIVWPAYRIGLLPDAGA